MLIDMEMGLTRLRVRACARARVCACVCVCVRACVRVCRYVEFVSTLRSQISTVSDEAKRVVCMLAFDGGQLTTVGEKDATLAERSRAAKLAVSKWQLTTSDAESLRLEIRQASLHVHAHGPCP